MVKYHIFVASFSFLLMSYGTQISSVFHSSSSFSTLFVEHFPKLFKAEDAVAILVEFGEDGLNLK